MKASTHLIMKNVVASLGARSSPRAQSLGITALPDSLPSMNVNQDVWDCSLLRHRLVSKALHS